MPMIPMAGPEDQAGFGQGPPQLGGGGYAGMDAMGGDPTDPSATVAMNPMAPATPTSIAEAIQVTIEQRQAALAQRQQAEQEQLLMADLAEADAFVSQMMQVIGGEAATLDGPGGVPAGPGAPPAGLPEGPDGGGGMAAAMMGEAAPAGPAGIPPEMLERAMAGGGY